MKSMTWVAVVLVVGAVGEARAQGSGYPSGALDGVVYGAMAFDLSFQLAGLLTAVGSSEKLAHGKPGKHWFIGSAVFGTLNLGLSALCLYGAMETRYGGQLLNPALGGFALSHLLVGVWNAVLPAIAWKSGNIEGPAVTPMVFNGRSSSGRRWSGLGIQVTGF